MKFKHLILLLWLLYSGMAFSQVNTYKNEYGIQVDNDGFLAQRSDRYYTAGDFGYFRHALTIKDTASSKLKNKILGFELGQKIFNPQTGVIPDAIYIDRPFAGYLYLGTNLNLLYKNESNLKLQVRVGMVGPHAYGKDIQELIHNTFGFYHLSGWEYQVQDAFQLNLSAEYNKLLTRGSNKDLSFNSRADLGTGIIGAGAGFLFRWGTFNQLYNSFSTNSTVSANHIKTLHDEEFFFYYKPMLNVVGYDATTQGNLFKSTPATNEILVSPNTFLFTQDVGGAYVKGHWVLNAAIIFETRETPLMSRTGHWGHQWGSLSGVYRF